MNNRRISQEENPVESSLKTLFLSILTGIGLAIGFYIARNKMGMR